MFTKDTRTFEEKLKIGNEKEEMLIDFLNLCGIKSKKNNETDVTDVDIELTIDNIFLDCKYLETPYHMAFRDTGIQPANCLTLKVRHINNYAKKQFETGKEVWVACIVDYIDYDIYELVFFPNSYLHNLVLQNKSEYKLHVDRRNGIDLYEFLNYTKSKRN